VAEIREWLEGWKCTDGAGTPAPSLPLESILALLDCEQDGIEGWRQRKLYSSNSRNPDPLRARVEEALAEVNRMAEVLRNTSRPVSRGRADAVEWSARFLASALGKEEA